MKKLERKYIANFDQFLVDHGRLIDSKLFTYHFKNGNALDVIRALKLYQNKDGGFGQGLEPDFRMPDSSPVDTSIGLKILKEFDDHKIAKPMIGRAVRYLESTFDENRNGWFAVPNKVNDYPHTPWWDYDEKQEMTVIDKNWGNPTVELIGYLYKYRNFVEKLDVDKLVETAVEYINNKKEFNSENELYCYVELYKELPENYQNQIKDSISLGISQVIEYDRNKWTDYVPLPLDFISKPDDYWFGIKVEKVEENLDFYVDLIEENTVIDPPWGEDFYNEGLKRAYKDWQGVLTLDVFKKLDNFDRIS
ncbi:MAG: hypothetical protein K9K76_07280 [Halanaerobiales bacterium]|nr:hypothetical protein [Halanaerobiales bacterium]